MKKENNDLQYELSATLTGTDSAGASEQYTVVAQLLYKPNMNMFVQVKVNGRVTLTSDEIDGMDGKLAYNRVKQAWRAEVDRIMDEKWALPNRA